MCHESLNTKRVMEKTCQTHRYETRPGIVKYPYLSVSMWPCHTPSAYVSGPFIDRLTIHDSSFCQRSP